MNRATRIAFALAAGAAFCVGAEGSAIAGDPDSANEAPPPGPAPALGIWDQERRSAVFDGLRVAVDGGALAFRVDGSAEARVDYDVRCEMVMGNPLSRVYVPPTQISQMHAEGRVAVGETLRLRLDLAGADAAAGLIPGDFDMLRVTLRPRGAPDDAEPLAILQVPHGARPRT